MSNPDAEEVVLALAAEGVPITDYVVYSAGTDPNELLGRPGGYTSKVTFSDDRLEPDSDFNIDTGGSVEVLSSLGDAANRFEYVDAITSGGGLFGEYHWLVGTVFLRVSQSLTPDEADEYQQALMESLAKLSQGVAPPELSEDDPAPTESPTPASPTASAYVGGSGDPSIPDGKEGALEVVLKGPYTSHLPIVIRNRTPEALIRVEVSAVARDRDGEIVVTGADQGLNPNHVGPGEIAFGYVYFDGVDLPPDTTFEFTLDAEPSDGEFAEFENRRDLEATTASFRDGRVTGEFRNTSSERIEGPIDASVLCFSGSGDDVLGIHSDFTDQDFAAPGGVLPFTVSIGPDDCPQFLFAASGFSR